MLITTTTAAKILKTSEGTVRAMKRRGELPATRTETGIRLFDRTDGHRVPLAEHGRRGQLPQARRWFVLREIHAGRLRAAVVGGRREILTRRDWCDQWVIDQATPIVLPARRRA